MTALSRARAGVAWRAALEFRRANRQVRRTEHVDIGERRRSGLPVDFGVGQLRRLHRRRRRRRGLRQFLLPQLLLRPMGLRRVGQRLMLRSVRLRHVRRSGNRAAERQQQACNECGFHRMYFQPKSMPGRQNSGWNRPRASATTDKTTIKSSHPAREGAPDRENRAVYPARKWIRLPGSAAERWRPRRDSNSQPMESKSIALSS